MASYGADVEQLKALARQFSRAADELQSNSSSVTSVVNSVAAWRGPDAGQFRSSWNGEHSRKIASTVRALQAASDDLKRNAAEQTTASTDGSGGSGGSGGAGTGGSPTPAGTGGSQGKPDGDDDIPHNIPRPDIDGNPGDTSDAPRHSTEDPKKPGFGAGTGAGKWTEGQPDGNYSFAGGEADASAGTTYGPNGEVSHDANSGALWGAGAGTKGSNDDLPGDMSSSGTADAFAGGYATADAHAGIDKNGQANASASAGGFFGGEASAGGRLDSGHNSSVGGSVGTMVGVQAAVAAGGSIGPQGISANAGVQALAGASATAQADIEVAGANVGGSVTGYAGAGVVANADIALTKDDVHFSIDLGIAYGLGVGAGLDVSFSPKDVLGGFGIDIG
jgi:uncharacterized protein YukE